MAATRLIALHANKGKTISQCIRDRTDYTVYFFSTFIQNAFGNEIERRNIYCIAKRCYFAVFSF